MSVDAAWTMSDRKRTASLCVVLATIAMVIAACGGGSSSESGSENEAQATTEAPAGDTGTAPTEADTGAAATDAADTGASGGLAEAEQIVAEAMAPRTWEAPGPAFDASTAAGKTMGFVPIVLSIPFETILTDGMKEGLDTVGVNFVTCDPKGVAAEEARCFDSFISQGVDVLSASGIDSARIGPQLEAAAAAGIPYFPGHNYDPGPVPDSEPQPPVVATASHSSTIPGQWLGAWAVADSGGAANVIILSASDSATSKPIEDGINSELERLCGDGCTSKTVDAPIAQWPDLTTRIQSVLRENPDTTHILPVFDGMVLYLVPGVHAAGFQDKVKIGSFNGSPDVMQLLKDGDVVGAEVGGAILWEGWGFADQALRILTDNPPVDDIKTPLRLFTAENIGEVDLEAQESTWYGDVDFKAEYEKLWGVG